MTPRDLLALKKEYEEGGGYVSDAIRSLPEGQAPLMSRQAAGLAREELSRAMDQAAPETLAAFEGGKRDYGAAAAIENLARDRKNADWSRLVPSMLAGATAGGTAGLYMGHGPGGALGGAAAGALGNFYGRDMAANTMRLGQSAARWAGGAGDVASRSGALLGGAAGPEGAPYVDNAVDWLGSQSMREEQARKTMDESRGHQNADLIKRTLQQNPQALGQYAPRLQEVLQGDDDMRFSAAIQDLNQTDPEFRATIRKLNGGM